MNALPMKPSTMFVPLLVLFLGVIMMPLAALAQCGAGLPSGFGGPTHIVIDPLGGVYYGGFSGGEWTPVIESFRNTLDYNYYGSTFSLLNLFIPSALAQCGGVTREHQSPDVSLTATPGTINLGNSSSLTWGSANVTSCTGTGFSTDGETQGTVPVSPTSTTKYSITCSTGSGGNGTWQYESTDYTDLACPVNNPERVHRNTPDCASGNPEGQSCTAGSRCKINSGGTSNGLDGNMSGSCVVETTIYSCGGGSSVSDDATVVVNSGGPLAVSCSATPNPQSVDDSVMWSANVSGGVGGYTYSWSGSDGLTGSGSSVQKSYATTGSKSASVMVTSGTQATSVACEALEVENPVAPECSDGIDNNGTGGIDTNDTEACDGPDDDDESNPNGSLSCTVDSTLIDVGANTTYHAIGVAGPYTWQLSGQTNCSGGANNNCDFLNPGEYSMRVSAPGVGAPKLCPFVTAGCSGIPAADISASRTRVNPKDTVNLTWNASGVMQATCVVSGPGVNEIVQSTSCQVSGGPLPVQVMTQSIYTIDCGEDAVDSIIVNVTSDQIEF